jgi:VCBS repeat-containing protein
LHGVFSITAAGDWTYAMDRGATQQFTPIFSGIEVFLVESLDGTAREQFSIAIEGSNDPLVAADDFARTDEDTPLNIPFEALFVNDFDVDTAFALIDIDSSNTLGTLVNHGAAVTYTPNAAFDFLDNGQRAFDSFDYTIIDSFGLRATATVIIEVGGITTAQPSQPPASATIGILPGLEVTQTTINGGDVQRSNVESISIEFSLPPNSQDLIDTGAIASAIQIANTQAASLTPGHFRYDPILATLTIDLTIDGFGGSRATLLHNGRYELRIDTSMLPLTDDDGTVDGFHRFDFHRLEGDFNGDRSVANDDRDLFFAHYGSKRGHARYDFAFDLTQDGVINIADHFTFIKLMGKRV